MLQHELADEPDTLTGMADAFGTAYWWAATLIVLALGAAVLLPRRERAAATPPLNPRA